MKNWLGNRLPKGERFVVDGPMMILTSAITSKPQLLRLSRPGVRGMITVAVASKEWRRWTLRRQTRSKPGSARHEIDNFIYSRWLVGRKQEPIWLDGYRLKILTRSGVAYDRVTVPVGYPRPKIPVVFWQRKRPVALLMQLRAPVLDESR